MKCIMNNQKTIKSVDFTTNCPKRQNGNPCKYCYVECSRNVGYNAKKVIDEIPYNGEVKRLTKATIEKLNNVGGLRLFSFGDYMREQYNHIYQFLTDCRAVGLKVKVITKQVNFVDDFYNEFEDVFSIIHLSIDNIGNGVDWKVAQEYKDKYSKVIIRSVILKNEDLEVLEGISDILTFNHANVKNSIPDSINYKLKPALFNHYKEIYADKVCCNTGNCSTCPIKCKAIL